MAEEKKQEAEHISITCVENGYKIAVCYEAEEKSLGARAGWYPAPPGESKDYVEKTKDAVLKRLKEIL